MQEKHFEKDGTFFEKGTDPKVAELLSKYMNTNTRIRIFLGDPETGRDWMEVYDTIGTIGRSTGPYKIPLLLRKNNSSGGTAILTKNILKITVDKKVVYQNKNYKLPNFSIKDVVDEEIKKEGYCFNVVNVEDGKTYQNTRTREEAKNAIAFYQGTRNKIA